MPAIQVRADVSPDDLLRAVDQMQTSELDDFVQRVLTLRAGRLTHCLSQEETTLLLRINEGYSPDVWRRFQDLIGQRQDRTISPEELAELIELAEQAERFDADRLAAVIDLARLRQTTPDRLMDELGLRPASENHG